MADKKLIPNSTQIPNIVLDFLLPQLPEAEKGCIRYICRRTYGFHKDEDRISFSQFVNGLKDKNGKRLDYGSGLSRPSVSEGLKNLRIAKAIFVRKDSKGNYYKINLNMDVEKVVKEINQLRKDKKNRPKQKKLLKVVKKVNQLSSLTKTGKGSKPKLVKEVNLQKKGNKGNKVNNIVNYFFELKGWANKEKSFYKKNKIVYSRFTRPAKELLELCEGDEELAKKKLSFIKQWAEEKGLEWGISTAIKRWFEKDKLKEQGAPRYKTLVLEGDKLVEKKD